MTWTPILDTDDRLIADASAAVTAVVDGVMQRHLIPGSERRRIGRPSDEPLLYAYLALSRQEDRWCDLTTEHLNAAIENFGVQTGYPALFGGLSGLGWVVEHVSRAFEDVDDGDVGNARDDTDDEDLNQELDAELIRRLQAGIWDGPYDLIAGLVGMGIYFLERLPSERAARGIALVVDQLEALSERHEDGTTWYSGPELLPPWQQELWPNGYYNLGVAHGIPGVLFFLSEVAAARLQVDRVERLLDGGMQWFLSRRHPPGARSWFSSWTFPGAASSDSRLAWCYGDLGVLAIVHQIAHRTGRQDWQAFASGLLDHCLARPVDDCGVVDAPLCHGAAGVAHIYNRLFQESGDVRCRDAALVWFRHALAMRRPDMGIGGFVAVTRPDRAGPLVFEPSIAFLDGAIGVALALLAALTSVEPQWDRMLLLSGRTK